MSTSRSRLAAALAALTLAGTVGLARPAAAAPDPALAVTVTADRAQVVLDLDGRGRLAGPVTLAYDVVVENRGDGLITGVVATLDLPAGLTAAGRRRPAFAVGDLGARGLWRARVAVAADGRAASSPRLLTTATAAAGDGTTAVSAPAGTDVIAISAVTIERRPRRSVAKGLTSTARRR